MLSFGRPPGYSISQSSTDGKSLTCNYKSHRSLDQQKSASFTHKPQFKVICRIGVSELSRPFLVCQEILAIIVVVQRPTLCLRWSSESNIRSYQPKENNNLDCSCTRGKHVGFTHYS